MGDLAFHESLVSILRHFGDPRYFPEGLYRRNLGEPNQLFHAAAWAVAWVFPTDTACKIVVAATVLGISVGAGRLASHLGTTRWRAMLVAPLGLGWMFRWGLVANLVGFALLLFALPALDRLAKKPSPVRALHAMLLTGLLYLGHESSMVVYAIASGVLALQTPRRLSAFMWVSCPGAVAVALATIYAIRSEPLKAAPRRSRLSLGHSSASMRRASRSWSPARRRSSGSPFGPGCRAPIPRCRRSRDSSPALAAHASRSSRSSFWGSISQCR
jgi:hypothetical protein